MRFLHRPVLASCLMFAAVMLLFPGQALAVKGRQAVGMCIDSTSDGSLCFFNVNDKGEIDICNKHGCVYCPSATEECVMAKRGRATPSTTLPVDSTVSTALGTYKVQRRTDRGDLLTALAPGGSTADPACRALTQASVQALTTAVAQGRTHAQRDVDTNGVNGRYAAAATSNHAHLQEAERQLKTLDASLAAQRLYLPALENPSAAALLHETVGKVSGVLQQARHWAGISAVSHASVDAKRSLESTSEALGLSTSLGAAAAACHLSFYLR